MFVSEARRRANQLNSQKSTGPRTAEGKARSRGNALKHGLCASVLAQEGVDEIQAKVEALHAALRPADEFRAAIVDRAAVAMARLERCERVERRVRTRVAIRAELAWDDDRRLEAEEVGGLLAIQPGQAVEALRRTPHGCDWLMARWAMLAHAADVNGEWDEAQTALAYDLLGTPREFRTLAKPGTALDYDGRVVGDAARPAEVARDAIAELREQREAVAELDAVERERVADDYDHDSDAELRRLRRYETALHNRLRWIVNLVRQPAPQRPLLHQLIPRWLAERPTSPAPEPPHPDEVAAANHPRTSLQPPFCLEPDEFPAPGQKADIPVILSKRRRQRLEKAKANQGRWRKHVDQPRA
jgi:hypothetical protein